MVLHLKDREKMADQLQSHADRLRAARKHTDDRAYDATQRKVPDAKARARFRSSRSWQTLRKFQLAQSLLLVFSWDALARTG